MSTAQRRGSKQSKLASWQQLNSTTQPVVEATPKTTERPKVETFEEVVVINPDTVEFADPTPNDELPRIVKKSKKS